MFARTERLFLRPGWPEDAPALAAAFGQEAVVMSLARAPWPYGLADAAAFLALDRAPDQIDLLIFAREPRIRLIGGIGLAPRDGAIELGYWLEPGSWNQGYCTEAGRAVLALARASGIRALGSAHFTENPASGAVLRKLGFIATGAVEQRECAARGVELPCALYTLSLA